MCAYCTHCCELVNSLNHTLSAHRSRVLVRYWFSLLPYMWVANFLLDFQLRVWGLAYMRDGLYSSICGICFGIRQNDGAVKQTGQKRQPNGSVTTLSADERNSVDSLSSSKLTHRVDRSTAESAVTATSNMLAFARQHSAKSSTSTDTSSSQRQPSVRFFSMIIIHEPSYFSYSLNLISQLRNKFHGHFATPLEYVISLISDLLVKGQNKRTQSRLIRLIGVVFLNGTVLWD